ASEAAVARDQALAQPAHPDDVSALPSGAVRGTADPAAAAADLARTLYGRGARGVPQGLETAGCGALDDLLLPGAAAVGRRAARDAAPDRGADAVHLRHARSRVHV